jgi:Rps23 Pro-64 3,4-dihydroxylase Tpa1-like proline 4-hydroxylase
MMSTPLRLSNVEAFSQPFQYIVSPEAFDPDAGNVILAWLESEVPWKLVEADFYEQYEFSLWDVSLPTRLAFLRTPAFLAAIKQRMAELFGVNFGHWVEVTAHKLIAGQRIRMHNDFIPKAETHRLLIQFNRGWQDDHGGFFLFFNSADPADIHKIFRPVHNSAVGFAITTTSYHAVSTVYAGERFTLVYSFYGQQGHGKSS